MIDDIPHLLACTAGATGILIDEMGGATTAATDTSVGTNLRYFAASLSPSCFARFKANSASLPARSAFSSLLATFRSSSLSALRFCLAVLDSRMSFTFPGGGESVVIGEVIGGVRGEVREGG